MEFLFCGVDVSKDKLDYALCHASSKAILDVSDAPNTMPGIRKLIRGLVKRSKGYHLWVCLEHTGNYSLLLTHLLEQAEITFSVISSLEIIKSNGLTRGKTDPVDAQRIARYAATFQHRLKPTTLASNNIMKLKVLLTVRDHSVRMRTQCKNALKSLHIAAQVLSMKVQIRQYQTLIKELDKQVLENEQQMLKVISADADLKTTYDKITKVIGIGQITAVAVILYTHNFTLFDNPRKFNCYCGLAPFEYSSGTSVHKRTQTSKYRNKMMKKLLFNASNTAINRDMQLRTYYNRKLEEGKHKMSVINAVACKLVYRIFAVAKRDTPFVEFSV